MRMVIAVRTRFLFTRSTSFDSIELYLASPLSYLRLRPNQFVEERLMISS
jgi:hypothetical protein